MTKQFLLDTTRCGFHGGHIILRMKIFGARNKYIDIFSNIYINNTLICKYFIMTHYENNNSSEKVQDAQMQENFANLCKAKEITEVVDIITERA